MVLDIAVGPDGEGLPIGQGAVPKGEKSIWPYAPRATGKPGQRSPWIGWSEAHELNLKAFLVALSCPVGYDVVAKPRKAEQGDEWPRQTPFLMH
jgi:hypothetical protein